MVSRTLAADGGVKEERGGYLSVLGLGSNKPFKDLSPAAILAAAARDLSFILSDLRFSSLYETDPLYLTDQAPFFNAAVCGFFSPAAGNAAPLSAAAAAKELLTALQALEARFGRDRPRERRWGERSLDIDILLFGDFLILEPSLVIPHPRLKERAFALRPLLDLLPEIKENGTGIPYSRALENLPNQGIRCLGAFPL